jgi:hypothetical protein
MLSASYFCHLVRKCGENLCHFEFLWPNHDLVFRGCPRPFTPTLMPPKHQQGTSREFMRHNGRAEKIEVFLELFVHRELRPNPAPARVLKFARLRCGCPTSQDEIPCRALSLTTCGEPQLQCFDVEPRQSDLTRRPLTLNLSRRFSVAGREDPNISPWCLQKPPLRDCHHLSEGGFVAS